MEQVEKSVVSLTTEVQDAHKAGDADVVGAAQNNLAALGGLRPGSLSTPYKVCGSPGCRCKATPPVEHGPDYQVSYTRNGNSSSKFVKKEALPAVRKQLKNHERMKRLMEHWLDLATELATLRLTPKAG